MENTDSTSTPVTGNQAATIDDGKTIAIVSYLSIIGWIIAFVMYGNNKTPLGIYHLRQTIALYVVGLGCWILQIIFVMIPIIGWIISFLLIFVYIALFVFWIIGLIAAVNGQEKPMPVIGAKAQNWFKGIK